jgi:hypothetical protein
MATETDDMELDLIRRRADACNMYVNRHKQVDPCAPGGDLYLQRQKEIPERPDRRKLSDICDAARSSHRARQNRTRQMEKVIKKSRRVLDWSLPRNGPGLGVFSLGGRHRGH